MITSFALASSSDTSLPMALRISSIVVQSSTFVCPLVLETFELCTVGHGFRVHFPCTSGEPVSPITVGNVVGTAAEGIDGAHGQSLIIGEILERVVKVSSFSFGQLLAITVGQPVKFSGWLF